MLLCGDYRLLGTATKVNLILTSPPYNIGSRCPKIIGGRRKGGYDAKSWGAIEGYPDSLPEDVYQRQQREFLLWCSEKIVENGVIVYNHKPRHKNMRLIHPMEWMPLDVLDLYEEVVWDRRSTHNHAPAFLHQHTERLYVLKHKGVKPYFNRVDLRDGFSTSDVWSIAPRKDDKFVKQHNAPFPMSLARIVVERWCPPGGSVCDPYSGSGTTMICAKLCGRSFEGSERERKYFELAQKRLREYAA